jgi:hypothetical protein
MDSRRDQRAESASDVRGSYIFHWTGAFMKGINLLISPSYAFNAREVEVNTGVKGRIVRAVNSHTIENTMSSGQNR